MICPYIVHRKVVLQVTYDHDEDGQHVATEQIEYNTATPMTCTQEECTAWQEGRCRYRSDSG